MAIKVKAVERNVAFKKGALRQRKKMDLENFVEAFDFVKKRHA